MLSARILLIIEQMRLYSFLFSFILLSSAQVAAEEKALTEATASGAQASNERLPRVEPDREANLRQTLLNHPDPSTQVVQLETGKNNEKMMGYLVTEASGNPQGNILLFPDERTHMDWPDNLHQLRTGLADYGWYTLAVFLPQPNQAPLPERTLPVLTAIRPTTDTPPNDADNSDSAATSEENTTTTEPAPSIDASKTKPDAMKPKEEINEEAYQELIFRLGRTGYEHLKAESEIERTIVLGVGSGATWAAQYVQKYQEEQELRLLLLDARNPKAKNTPDLLSILPEIKTTIIDMHHSPMRVTQNSYTNNTPERRLKLARHKRMNNFHQSRLPQTHDNWKSDNPRLLKHVRGMLNTYIIKAEQMRKNIDLPMEEQSDENEQPPG